MQMWNKRALTPPAVCPVSLHPPPPCFHTVHHRPDLTTVDMLHATYAPLVYKFQMSHHDFARAVLWPASARSTALELHHASAGPFRRCRRLDKARVL